MNVLFVAILESIFLKYSLDYENGSYEQKNVQEILEYLKKKKNTSVHTYTKVNCFSLDSLKLQNQ